MFDRYVVVDWSAAARPVTGRDSIWIADRGRTGPADLVNPSTRHDAWRRLDAIAADGESTLIGVDVSLGFPAGTAALLGGSPDAPPWRANWTAIAAGLVDGPDNVNNRFEAAAALNQRAGAGAGPFWGCPHDRLAPALERTKPSTFPIPEFREVERRLRGQGRFPKSCWQLLGAGAVGGQSLTFLPGLLARLDEWPDVAVWPFDAGFDRPAARTVVAEVWPTLLTPATPPGWITDAWQVESTSAALVEADLDGRLATWWRPEVTDAGAVQAEEGWVLGVV